MWEPLEEEPGIEFSPICGGSIVKKVTIACKSKTSGKEAGSRMVYKSSAEGRSMVGAGGKAKAGPVLLSLLLASVVQMRGQSKRWVVPRMSLVGMIRGCSTMAMW